MEENPKCPDCGAELWREEVDIGVGTMTGPWTCNQCGWVEYGMPLPPVGWKEGDPLPF